jgi:hypothetical protein
MAVLAFPKTFPRFFSPEMRVFYRLSSLFPNRSKVWSDYYLQGRVASNAPWVTLKAEDYDPLVIWGYENRIQRMISESINFGSRGSRLRQRMVQFVAGKHASLFPESPPLVELRFVRVIWPVGESQAMSQPVGRWRALPLDLVPAKQKRIVSSHRVQTSAPVATPLADKPGAQPPVRKEPIASAAGLTDESLMAALASGKEVIQAGGSSRVTPQGLSALWNSTTVTSLSLAGRKLGIGEMKGLGGMAQLQKLDVSGTAFPKEGLEELVKLKQLRVLNLRGLNLRGRDLVRLTELPLLERLDIGDSPEVVPVLMQVARWPALQELRLRSAKGLSAALAAMPAHPTLSKLDLTRTDLTPEDVGFLARHPKLRLLVLDGTAVDDTVIPHIEKVRGLTALSVTDSLLSAEGLRQLAKLPQLIHLKTGESWRRLKKPVSEPATTSPAQPGNKASDGQTGESGTPAHQVDAASAKLPVNSSQSTPVNQN